MSQHQNMLFIKEDNLGNSEWVTLPYVENEVSKANADIVCVTRCKDCIHKPRVEIKHIFGRNILYHLSAPVEDDGTTLDLTCPFVGNTYPRDWYEAMADFFCAAGEKE